MFQTVFVSGGPMEKGYTKDGTPIDLATAFEAVGKHETGEMSDEELKISGVMHVQVVVHVQECLQQTLWIHLMEAMGKLHYQEMEQFWL